jgi:predicted RecB family nuclease
MRVEDVTKQHARLLLGAGINTVEDLMRKQAADLFSALKAVKDARDMVDLLPLEESIADWINQAKKLTKKTDILVVPD